MTTVIEDPETLISRFGWPDYLVFAAMLSVSAIIGVYYAWYNYYQKPIRYFSKNVCQLVALIDRQFSSAGGKQSTTSEFLMAGRSMSTFPVAMSLIAR